MCGICGQLNWGQPSQIDKGILERMNRSLTHRGPDDEGYFTDSFEASSPSLAGSIGLAMRRLSIIDLSSGHQPMTNETGDVVVVYNGETDNFMELRAELIALGHQFTSHSDTEVLVHGYEVWGDEMPTHLNGMFGFALWDKRNKKLLLVRDRMGIKPVYYALFKDRLIFGSEIKAILEDPRIPRDIDPFAVDDFLSQRAVPTPRSIYQSIRKLDPATMLIWEKGEIRFKRYWDYEPQDFEDHGVSYYLERVDALLADAVKRQLISDVPLGTFLSGGIDSPTISYYAKKEKADLMTFTIYFSEKTFSERDEAALVARFLGTHHVEKEVSSDIVKIIPKLIDIFDEPFGDDSMIPTFFLTKLAREKMTVALSGDGGDELFAGYPTYLADRLAMIYKAIPSIFTKGLLEPLINSLPVSFERMRLEYKAKAFISAVGNPSPLEHFGWTAIFRPQDKKELYRPEFWDQVAGRSLAENFEKAFSEAGSREGLEKFLYVDQKTHLLDEFLVKVDRLSMAHSLEVRPPFLDHRMVELAAEIPMKYKLRGWTMKWLLRKLMKGRLPESILKGEKKGFSPPIASWLAGDLLGYVRAKFSPDRIRDIPFFNPDYPLRLLERHLKKEQNHSRKLWPLLMFVEWYDRKVLNRA